MQTTPAISSSEQQAKKVIKKYKNKKKKINTPGTKTQKKINDNDIVFLKQVPLQPRLAMMNKT